MREGIRASSRICTKSSGFSYCAVNSAASSVWEFIRAMAWAVSEKAEAERCSAVSAMPRIAVKKGSGSVFCNSSGTRIDEAVASGSLKKSAR